MREQIFIRVLDRASSFMQHEDIVTLRAILDEELYPYTITPACTDLVPTNTMLSQIKIYLAVKKLDGCAQKSIENYGRTLLKFAVAFQRDTSEITDMDVRMYLAVQKNRGISNNTLNSIIAPIRGFFKWLEDEELIKKSPARKIKHIKVNKKVRKALNRKEFEMLRDSCKTIRDTAMVEFFYCTGCRLDEIQQLNISKIDWSKRSVVVIGKGNKERIVYLSEKAQFHLEKYIQSRNDNNDAIFVTERNPHGRLGRRMIQSIFSDMGKRACIQKPVFPHLMRHTTATNMLRGGTPMAYVQNYLGHTNPATTQIYADVAQDAIQQSCEMTLAG